MLLKRGVLFSDISNRGRLGAMPTSMQNPVDIQKPDLRQLERNLRKINGVSRKAAKVLCNKMRNTVNWEQNRIERDAENAAQMHDYLAPQRDAENKLQAYSVALCEAELLLLDEYAVITKNNLLTDYSLIHKNILLGKYNEH